jgi:hypothetical protein
LDTDFHRCTQIQKPIKPIAFGEKRQANLFPQTLLHCTFRCQAEIKYFIRENL